MPRLTTGEAIVGQLRANHVDTVFGLPGAQTYALIDALAQAQDDIRFVGSRHEQGAAYMAFGYAKSTGRPGVYTVVPGPGFLNTGAALVTAQGTNTPVLALIGQVPTAFLGRGRGQLHELKDQLATARTLTKWAERINHPAEAPGRIDEAFRQMLSGRPGTAMVEAPWDTLGQAAEVALLPQAVPPAPPPVDETQIDAACALLAEAKAPMIMVGGGALHAGEEIRALAERLSAPVTAFRSGRGIVSDEHPLGFVFPSAHLMWPKSDALIAIGTRLELPYMRWAEDPHAKKTVRIDIDAEEIARLPADVPIVADAKQATAALLEALERRGIAGAERAAELAEAKAGGLAAIRKVQPQLDYLDVIREVLPRNGFFVEELCQVGFASWYGFPVYEPRKFVTCGFQGTLGFGLPTAMGVKVANPSAPVVSVLGDGGFMFCVQELAMAVQENIAITAILFNNGAFGNVRRDQQTRYQGRELGSELLNPDFLKLCDAFGVQGTRVDSPESLRPALERALALDAPAVIEVVVPFGSEASPWEFIMPKGY